MSNRRKVSAISVLGMAMIALSLNLADAQTKTSQSVEVNTLGLPLPGNSLKMIMAPAYGGGLTDTNYMASVHWDPTLVPGLG